MLVPDRVSSNQNAPLQTSSLHWHFLSLSQHLALVNKYHLHRFLGDYDGIVLASHFMWIIQLKCF